MTKKAEVVKLAVAAGVLLQAPVWEAHFRGSNWLAIIGVDPAMPGGLSRRFLPRGKGECLYVLEQLALFDPVEFGADYTTTAGRRNRTQWHGVVTAVTDGYLLVERSASGMQAILRAREARESAADRVNALRAERETLLERIGKLDEEMQMLEAPEYPAAGGEGDEGG